MSRKDFELIAQGISAIADPMARFQAAAAVAGACSKSNPRFDMARFFRACGV